MGKNRALLLALACVVCAGPSSPSANAKDAGSLTGNVTLSPKLAAHPMRFALYADANRAGGSSAPRPLTDELQNVVVYLEHVALPPDALLEPPASARMEQEGLNFHPHVLPIVKGTVVEFPNRDLLFHNVFSLSKTASFDLGRFPKNASKSLRFDTPGIVKVFCHIHSDMSGVIVVLDNGFYAQPNAAGRFVIDGIPPGDYRVVAWHERARMAAKPVRIEAGRAAALDFDIPLTEDVDGD